MKSFISSVFVTSVALATLVGAQAAYAQTQTDHDWYRVRAVQEGAPPASIVDQGTSPQTECRYLYSGGPKEPITC
jgi:hypothetical protein